MVVSDGAVQPDLRVKRGFRIQQGKNLWKFAENAARRSRMETGSAANAEQRYAAPAAGMRRGRRKRSRRRLLSGPVPRKTPDTASILKRGRTAEAL
jgi:hypothetical protein